MHAQVVYHCSVYIGSGLGRLNSGHLIGCGKEKKLSDKMSPFLFGTIVYPKALYNSHMIERGSLVPI